MARPICNWVGMCPTHARLGRHCVRHRSIFFRTSIFSVLTVFTLPAVRGQSFYTRARALLLFHSLSLILRSPSISMHIPRTIYFTIAHMRNPFQQPLYSHLVPVPFH